MSSIVKYLLARQMLVVGILAIVIAFACPDNPALAGLAVFAGPTMNVFDDNAFSSITLTHGIEKIPYTPGLLGQLNVFEPDPITTEIAAFEKRDGKLSLIQSSERGAPLAQQEAEKRDIRYHKTVRLAKGATIRAAEIQNIRAMGSETELQSVVNEVMRRYNGPTGLINDLNLTWEWHRLGAIQGIVLDADNSVITNWFDFWNITQPAEIDFALDTATTNVIGKCNTVVRAMVRAAQGAWIENRTQVHALAGDTFWDKFKDHAKVRDTYTGWEAAQSLRAGAADPNGGQLGQPFYFGGIYWHNYRGTDDFDENATSGAKMVGIAASKAKFFPVNAPGAFKWVKSPGESLAFANTRGLDYYGLLVRDLERDMWVKPEVYSYPLFVSTRPAMLQRAKAA